jgi:hypothetical protein
MKATAEPALAVFHETNSVDARLKAVNAAIDIVLDTPDVDLYEAIVRSALKPAQKHRNQFAHWIWADSPDLPDAILLVDPTRWTGRMASIKSLIRATLPVMDFAGWTFVYREKDLKDINAAMLRANDLIGEFHHMVLLDDGSERDALYRKLSSEPQVREALDRLLKDRQTPTEVLKQ